MKQKKHRISGLREKYRVGGLGKHNRGTSKTKKKRNRKEEGAPDVKTRVSETKKKKTLVLNSLKRGEKAAGKEGEKKR